MKIFYKNNFIFISLICLLMLLPVQSFSSEANSSIMLTRANIFADTQFKTIYIAADENKLNASDVPASGTSQDYEINWHKMLGWSTLGMMTVTIASGFIIPGDIHCGLAGFTTGLAVATCADGIYQYGGLISFTDGDWRYNMHAICGTLATAGFITTLTLADGKGHIVSGIASGTVFTIALGIIYF